MSSGFDACFSVQAYLRVENGFVVFVLLQTLTGSKYLAGCCGTIADDLKQPGAQHRGSATAIYNIPVRHGQSRCLCQHEETIAELSREDMPRCVLELQADLASLRSQVILSWCIHVWFVLHASDQPTDVLSLCFL